MKEEQGKKSPIVGELPSGKDDKVPVPAKPTALSDEDLDNVAGGLYHTISWTYTNGNGGVAAPASPIPIKSTIK